MDLNLIKLQEIVEDSGVLQSMASQRVGYWTTELDTEDSDWTTATKWNECFEYNYQKDFLYRKHYDLNPKTHF